LALTQINALSLYDCIFAPPLDVLPPLPTQNLLLAISALSHILSYPPGYPHIPALFPTRHEVYIAWVLAALAPWEGYTFPDLNPKKKAPGAATAVREGLKATNKLFDTVARSYDNTGLVREGMRLAGQGEWARSSAGILIKTLGVDWKSQVLCSMVLDLVKAWKERTVTPFSTAPESKQVLENYNTFIGKIYALGVEEAYSVTPILNVSSPLILFSLGWR
jgi:tRNA nucleotidyltransferase (CCA-adding enzyme)